jgi:hypothetical protein
MAENTNNGCGLWLFGAMIAALILGLFAVPSPSYSSTPASAPLVITVVPQMTDTYFAVENNQISYSYAYTLDSPCNYILVGRVLDLNGEPFTEYVVNIKMIAIEELAPEKPGYVFPGGGYIDDGASGWASLLSTWNADYIIWLTTEIGGEELSNHIYVPMRGCDLNQARINFVQVKPFP